MNNTMTMELFDEKIENEEATEFLKASAPKELVAEIVVCSCTHAMIPHWIDPVSKDC